MGAVQNVITRLRDAFIADKERGGELLAKGSTSPTYPDSGYDLLQAYGYDALSDYLRLEHDLLSRFVDYEEMDDHDLIASSIDIYADDASQPDTQLQRTVWVSSPDKTLQGVLDDLFYKRLRLDEEIWEITRSLCVAEGQRVWTSKGPKPIEEVQPGDWVQSYKEGVPALCRVKRVMNNGEREVYRLQTRHRELVATKDHPVLVREADGEDRWVKIEDLALYRFPSGGIDYAKSSKIVISTAAPEPSEAPAWDTLFVAEVPGRPWGEKGSPAHLKLPERIEPWFCRLLGFLWGDGFMGTEDLASTSTAIFFSRGEDDDQNEFYDELLERLGLTPTLNEDLQRTEVSSIRLKELLVRLGWKNGAARKRLPVWVGGLPRGHRKAFLEGFIDADGWVSKTPSSEWPKISYEIANVPLAKDIKNLVDGLGYRAGKVRVRQRPPGFEIKGRVVETTQPTGTLTYTRFRYEPGFRVETVNKVEKWGRARVYDLEIDDASHNFVVEGLPVHNCKYGNNYEELLVTQEGVVGLNFLPAPTVRRVEGPRGQLYGFVQDFRGRFGYSPQEFQRILTQRTAAIQQAMQPGVARPPGDLLQQVSALEPWEVAHFRLRGKHRRSIYGYSVLEPARWIWKRLMLLEDAAMIYRLQRAPERYAFYVDVGTLPPGEALAFVNKIRQQHKKKRYVNPSTGKLDLKFETLSPDDDFWVPVRQGVEGTRIEVLGGPSWQHMEDVEYFQTKLFGALKVPKAYLAQDDNTARAVLSSEDVRFARSVLRVQREVRNGLRKVARTHLAAVGIDPYSVEYSVHMTVPSSIFELAQLEVRNARADLASRMREHVSLRWVLQHVYQLSDDDIKVVIQERSEDVIREGKAQAEVEKLSAMAQAAAERGAGGVESAPAPTGLKLIERKLDSLPARLRGGISERELERGNRKAEKRAEQKVDQLLRSTTVQSRRLREVGALLREVAAAVRGR